MQQWVILGLASAVFVALIILVLYKKLTTSYPEGKRYKKKWGKYHLNLIVHNEAVVVDPGGVHKAAMNALKALVTAHKQARVRGMGISGSVAPTAAYFKEFTVYMVPTSMLPPNAAAYITKKDGVPTAVIGDPCEQEILDTGEPVIHEACHVVLNDYVGDSKDHTDPTIWAAHLTGNGKLTLQYAAREIYKQLRR